MRNRQMRQERRKKTGNGKGNTGREEFRHGDHRNKRRALDTFRHCPRKMLWHSLMPASSAFPRSPALSD